MISAHTNEEKASFQRAKEELSAEFDHWKTLADELASADQHDPLVANNLRTLQGMCSRVAVELKSVELEEAQADLELGIDGPSVQNHEAPAALLGRVLAIFQDLVNAVAQARSGSSTARGIVPASILQNHRLLVRPQFLPGSFTVMLRLSKPEDTGDCVPDGLETLEDILNSLRVEEEATPEVTRLLGHSRVKSQYGKLMELLAKEDVELKAATRRSLRGLRVTAKAARDRRDWLRALETKELEEDTFSGKLVGGDTERKRFRLLLEDGEEIDGDVSRDALQQMKQINYGAAVLVRVRRFETQHEDLESEPRQSYTALSFEENPAS